VQARFGYTFTEIAVRIALLEWEPVYFEFTLSSPSIALANPTYLGASF
jgi:hypothetical protein